MKSNFRSEVFKLCKSIQSNNTAIDISKLIRELSVGIQVEKNGSIKKNSHGDFSYIAQHSNNQFHGYLFVDDNAKTLQLPMHLEVVNLSLDERILIERGHKTLMRFIEMCSEDIKKESEIVAAALNPYSFYKEVKCVNSVSSILEDDVLELAVQAFQNGNVYKALRDSKMVSIFKKIDLPSMYAMIEAVEKSINNSFKDVLSSDLRDFSFKSMNQYENIQDIMYAFVMLIFALRESLKTACQMLYCSICGDELTKINNDNIINIESRYSNMICEHYKVLVQDVFLKETGNRMGGIVLFDCEFKDESHIHEFGMVIATTISFASEFGQTTKFSFVTIDEEMNCIHNITSKIIVNGLAKV